jgi:hypothetical protein
LGGIELTHASKDLLLRERALSTIVAYERYRPVGDCREPILEPGEERDVDAEPQQPRADTGELEPADDGNRAEPRDGGHGPEVDVTERRGLLAS